MRCKEGTLPRSEIVKRTGITNEQLDLLIAMMKDHFKNGGNKVLISELGAFNCINVRAQRTVHPQDKTRMIDIPARKKIVFRAAREFMSEIN